MREGINRQKIIDLHAAGDRAAALPLYLAWLEARPDDMVMWSNFGALLRAEGRPEQALRAQRRAQALAGPDETLVLNNLANVLADLGRNDEAITLRHRLLELRPDPQTAAMIGKSLRADSRLDAAIDWLRKVGDRHPDHVEIKLQLALALLTAGQYAEGFDAYGIRWQGDELTPRDMPMPKWDGGPIGGRRLLVMPEQGMGDSLAFARFLPELRRFGPGEVILEARRPVLRLLQGVAGADRVVADGLAAGADLWCDLMDLPGLAFARDTAVPAPSRLTVPADSRARAEAVLARHPQGLRVGVVWSGSPGYRANAARSFSHERFLPLGDLPGVRLFSLYKGPALGAFRADGSSAFIPDLGGTDRDFADCAALMERMDLIVTSDTATAHLAGSLGLPVWTLLHWDAFWLWGRGGETTPWYPSMRLIRQQRPHDWDPVFETLARDLAALAARKERT